MRTSFILCLLFSAFYMLSCASTSSKGVSEGTESNSCYRNETCNKGLICKNDICVLDKCFASNCSNNWEECSSETGSCVTKEGFCSKNEDCDLENGEKCNFQHLCLTNLCLNVDCSMDNNSECDNDTGACSCKAGYHKEPALSKCLENTKEINCQVPSITNSQVIVSPVIVNWNETTKSWESPKECEWSCNTGFYKSQTDSSEDKCIKCNCEEWQTCKEDGACSLEGNRCNNSDDCKIENQECDTNHYCINAHDPCENQNCDNKGTCSVSQNGIAKCSCDLGYKNNGNLSCISACTDITCSGHGDCVITETGSATCNCHLGYKLETEDTRDSLECINIDDCSPNPCLNGGQCIDKINSYKCLCINNWEGDNCQTLPCDGACDEWEYCTNDRCKVKPGRCNNNADCSENSLCFALEKKFSISPPIPQNGECLCNYTNNICEMSGEIQP